jgi:hypothetical protein
VRHQTLSSAPATSPGHWVPTVGALTSGATGQSGGAPDSHCLLSGAPSDACFDFCARSEHYSLFLYRCRRPLALGAVAPLGAPDSPVLHRTAPDRPVNYSGAASQISEGGKFRLELPGAPDTVWWCTGQSGAPDQGSLRLLCSILFKPFL